MLSGLRSRIFRPCTLIMVQKLHAKGQPREVSAVPKVRIGEMAHGFWTGLGKRRSSDIDEALQILGETIDRFQPVVEKIG